MSIRMTFIRVLAMALPLLLLLANTAWSSPHPSGSARDQYEARRDRLHHSPPRELISEATDHQGPVAAPFKTVDPARTRGVASAKKKRSYYPWAASNQVVYSEPYQSIQVWRAPTYQITRPYYIPVYGAPGRIPIYYPPQPMNFNAGQPFDNRRPFRGPTYLPPSKPTPTPAPDSADNVTLGNRHGDMTDRPTQPTFTDNDNEQRPIWGNVGFTESPGGLRQTMRPDGTVVSTRRPPRPDTTTTPPPLVHVPRNISSGSGGGSNSAGAGEGSSIVRTSTRRPQAFRPPPEQSRPEITGGWRPPPPPPSQQDPALGPSNCVWAIIACCDLNIEEVHYDCFEQRGCVGSFWDNNPCGSTFARAAMANAFNYYETKK